MVTRRQRRGVQAFVLFHYGHFHDPNAPPHFFSYHARPNPHPMSGGGVEPRDYFLPERPMAALRVRDIGRAS